MSRQPVPPALILAGGKGRRLGGDKALARLRGRPLLAWVLDRLAPQAGPIALNANGDPGRFAGFRLPVLADTTADQPGPLAGIQTGLAWLIDRQPLTGWLMTVSCDVPFLPGDLSDRLISAVREGPADAIIATRPDGRHSLCALWRQGLGDRIADQLQAGDHSVRGLLDSIVWRAVTVEAEEPVDPLFNINTPKDLARAEAILDGDHAT
jgi:molybdopterin-guanine dinucleotide biosynthesis protein A